MFSFLKRSIPYPRLRLFMYGLIAALCGIIFVISMNTLHPVDEQASDPVDGAEKLLQKNREIRQQTQPVNPEGKTCYAFFDYLQQVSEHDYTGMSYDQINAEIARQQKPVKDALATVKDAQFKKPFEEYFAHHDKVDAKQDDETTRNELKSISQVCSTDKATEVSTPSSTPTAPTQFATTDNK